jgi:hypothetical protein
MKKRLCLLASLLCVSIATFAAEPKTVKLMTIGNSFSANATKHLDGLAKAGGHKLIHNPLVIGGASFQVHAEKAQLHEKEPANKAGLYTSGRGLKENLKLDQWDYVTIQQASIKSHNFSTYQPWAGWLRDYIKEHAPNAKLLVHQTWEYRVDDPRFTKPSDKPGEPKTQEEMYRGLKEAYAKIAAEFGARLLPVGDAFHAVDTDPKWGYKPDTAAFDSKKAKPPELPKQTHSLHVGWKWTTKNGKTTLGMDGHHTNMAGEYLGGCVWYEVLFGESVVGNSYVPKGLDPEFARFLRETAHRTVAEQGQRS